MRRLTRVSLPVCLATALAAGTLHAQGPTCRAGVIDSSMRAIMQRARVQSAVWSAVFDTTLVSLGGFGGADPSVTEFRAASNAKVLVALAALIAERSHRLDLYRDVNEILHRVRVPTDGVAPVTVHHLLTHTSGFSDRFLGGLAVSPERVIPLEEYLTTHLPTRVLPVGAAFSYSNHGMALAGLVVQDAVGSRFDRYVDAEVFAPLGMTRATLAQPPPALIRRDMLHDARGDGPWLNPYPAGSLVTTAVDMAMLLRELVTRDASTNRVVTDALRARLLGRHFSAHPQMPGVAYGFIEGTAYGHRTLHHTGDGGQHSLIWLMPDAAAALFVAYTSPAAADAAAPREAAASAFADCVSTPLPHAVLRPLLRNDDRAAQFAGVYRPNQYATRGLEKLASLPAQIAVADGGGGTLLLSLGVGSPADTLVETAPMLFRSEGGLYVAFRTDVAGRVVGLTGTMGTVDDPLSAARISWMEDSRLHLMLLAFGLIAILLRLLCPVMLFVLRRVGIPMIDKTVQSAAWRVSGLVAIGAASSVLIALGGVLFARKPITAIPIAVSSALLLLTATAALGAVLAPMGMAALKRGHSAMWTRIVLASMVIAGAGLGPFLWYWQLLVVQQQ